MVARVHKSARRSMTRFPCKSLHTPLLFTPMPHSLTHTRATNLGSPPLGEVAPPNRVV